MPEPYRNEYGEVFPDDSFENEPGPVARATQAASSLFPTEQRPLRR